MNKRILYAGIGLFSLQFAYSQQKTDSVRNLCLKEVIIIGKTGLGSKNEPKPMSSVDEYMEQQDRINLIKRGSYAWEPTINNMASERTSVTIDGMKIFCACTDCMDPVSSYVEVINLNKMHIASGIGGNPYATNSIGGSLDMKLYKAGFHKENVSASVNSGYETNGHYRILGGSLAYSNPSFYSNSGVFVRKSDDYRAGGGEEVQFSQFQKVNLMSNFGLRLSGNRAVEASVIYDVATNVGYPALTMDVKSAKGLITSLSFTKEELSPVFSKWETKLYFNTITHIMDDTKRPNVAMHMDMPGKSKTAGFYSTLQGRKTRHNFLLNLDSYYNQSLAEMTMYSKNPDEKPMFMYTWPDVRTLNTSLFAEDKYQFTARKFLQVSARLAVQHDRIRSDFGLSTLQIYYPGMSRFQNRLLWNVAAKYHYYLKNIQVKVGGGYGLRAPSSSEAYGFYLFNSFDNYDYLGNPQLKNESSWEGNLAFSATLGKLNVSLEGSCFYLNNYIIGKPDNSLTHMTLNASGVKVYRNLDHATILTSDLTVKQSFADYFIWTNKASYSLGRDDHNRALPLIAPVSYSSSLSFNRKQVYAELKLQGAAKQYKYSADYGEDQTPAYLIFGASAGYDFHLKTYNPKLKVGVENLFDRKYSTYSDWNNISRKGRNYYINLIINLL
ncbi:MAG: TonB-dependent receptor [Bacteroidota bacterium]|nr:TonB-dependent receptor [Bacteroidota bacterium]